MMNEITNILTQTGVADFSETIDMVLSAIISIIGFVVTIFVTKKNIKTEIDKQTSKNFLDSFAGLEYDLAEILQLCVIEKLDIAKNNFYLIRHFFPYYIVSNRTEDYKDNDDCGERIYRLCGYITSFGSKYSRELFCMLQEEYHKNQPAEQKEDNLAKLIAIIALLFVQMKFDATEKYISYTEWIDIRLPIYDDKERIYKYCLEIIDEKDLKIIKKLNEKKINKTRYVLIVDTK